MIPKSGVRFSGKIMPKQKGADFAVLKRHRMDIAFSSEVGTGSREENASTRN